MKLHLENSFLRNISLLVSGTALAQLIPILLQPILKRIYTPEEFGIFDIYIKILGIMFVVYALKYDIGIVLPKNKVKAQALLLISSLSAILFTIISFLIILFFNHQILKLFNISPQYLFILYLLPFSTLFFSLYNTFNFLLIREKRFFASSMNKVSRRAIEGGLQVGIGYSNGIKSYGLFVGDLIGNLAYFISTYIQSYRGFKIDKRLFSYKFLKSIAKEYSDLPKYNLIPELLNSFFGASLTFIVLAKFNIIEVGLLESTQRLLVIPSAFISVSLGQVILQKISESVIKKEKIMHELKTLVLLMTGISILFTLFILFFGPIVFKLFLGETFEQSGNYAQYLIVYFAVSFLFSPFGQVLIALKAFKINAQWQILKFLIIYALFFVAFDNIRSFLLVYSAIGTIAYLIYGAIIFKKAKQYDNSL